MKKAGRPGKNPRQDANKFRSFGEIAALTGWSRDTVRRAFNSGVLKMKSNGRFEALLCAIHAVHDKGDVLQAGSVECLIAQKRYVK